MRDNVCNLFSVYISTPLCNQVSDDINIRVLKQQFRPVKNGGELDGHSCIQTLGSWHVWSNI